jgi:hypothetical protein
MAARVGAGRRSDNGIVCKGGELFLNRSQNAGHLPGGAFQVPGRADPERYSRDFQGNAPIQHVIELLCAKRIELVRIHDASASTEAAVAVQDDPDVARHRSLAQLSDQTALVDAVEKLLDPVPRAGEEPTAADRHGRAPRCRAGLLRAGCARNILRLRHVRVVLMRQHSSSLPSLRTSAA